VPTHEFQATTNKNFLLDIFYCFGAIERSELFSYRKKVLLFVHKTNFTDSVMAKADTIQNITLVNYDDF